MPDLTSFVFEGTPVRVEPDADGQLWFVAKDVCRVLEIENDRDAVARLDDDERVPLTVDTLGGPQHVNAISESGLYTLIFRSNKQQAKPFRRWVTHEVLPSIRKTGSYQMSPQPHSAVERLERLVALWSGQIGTPQDDLMEHVLAMFGTPSLEATTSQMLEQATAYVTALNAKLLEKANRVRPTTAFAERAFSSSGATQSRLVDAFWQTFGKLNNTPPEGKPEGWLNHSAVPGVIAVSLQEFLAVTHDKGTEIFYPTALRNDLRHSVSPRFLASNRCVYSCHEKKNIKCWVFQETSKGCR